VYSRQESVDIRPPLLENLDTSREAALLNGSGHLFTAGENVRLPRERDSPA
jgi:hypothetical protein